MKQILIFIFCLLLNPIFSQITLLEEYPYAEGEIGTYIAIYELGFLEIQGGEVKFEVLASKNNKEDIFHFKSYGNSLPKYDWIYKIRDTFQSNVLKENFQPIYYKRNTSEGSYSVFNETYFQAEEGKIIMELSNTEQESREKTMDWQADVFDLQTACYYARLLNFENAMMGEGYEFKIIIDGQLYTIPIRYEGKEFIELNEQLSFNCYRISTKVIEGTIFKSNQTIKIWVSDDGRNIPVKVEAPIKVGQVKAELIDYIEGK
ncbi:MULTISPECIES: DUF3108 domain-containing protein [unclassified Lentimicrobium]|uniref:DUF3108 domain-containing protein n=1 Tax=unclassified Lentimicrobium TaxID=2677434 RepID=UPI0015523FD7|nr:MULTISPECIES: DUF3108 domain-containing protein [unclassified Lentimicrobium]NPD45054.1 DUF3108 domain-containing protein [Lentimicrobium sp. S6]NPD84548.1 DUF3108 domain-containing protein [Lentimicrobium sp. L6]